MKAENISDAMGMVDEELIDAAGIVRKRKRKRPHGWMAMVAVAACLILVIVHIVGESRLDTAYAITKAEYPDLAQYPHMDDYLNKETGTFRDAKAEKAYNEAYMAWEKEQSARRESRKEYSEGMKKYMKSSCKEFLSGSSAENKIYSPMNAYMALSMLAEVTNENSRKQILEALGVDSIESLREEANTLWKNNYNDDGTNACILANSLWMNENVEYKKGVLLTLAKEYYASSFKGEMGAKAYDEEFNAWINEQTHGLLKEPAKDISFDSSTILALASTVYFTAKWKNEFEKTDTKEEVFYSTTTKKTCEFMHQTAMGDYYWGKGFTAIKKEFENNGNIWLVLPDKGVAPDALLDSEELMTMLSTGGSAANTKRMLIDLSMPKFDITSSTDLKEGLQALGIQDVFDSTSSDFTPLTKEPNLYLNQATQAARVHVDEEGCEAAAYTVLGVDAGGAEPIAEEIDFVLNRPFLFYITGATGIPIFVGVVNQP